MGAVFTRAYTTSPMCAPSRYSVLTGRYPSRCKHAQDRTTSCSSSNTLTTVTVPNVKLDLEQTSNLATTLKGLGYKTGFQPRPSTLPTSSSPKTRGLTTPMDFTLATWIIAAPKANARTH